VEEYIIAQTAQLAVAELYGDHNAIRALLRFSEEEIKHQKLFLRYCERFRASFGSPCKVLVGAEEIARFINSRSQMAVMLTTLHLELITQQHYVDAVRDRAELDPLFTHLLKHHWMEEAQHAKIDMLELARMAARSTQAEIEAAVEEYLGILKAFDVLLGQQVSMDLESLEAATGQPLSAEYRDTYRVFQLSSYRNAFIQMGLQHPRFQEIVEKLVSSGRNSMRDAARTFA
jgi:hypothetical protein